MKKAVIIRFWAVLGFLFVLAQGAAAQCAMCRAPMEGNVSDGTFLVSSDNLNTGIMYLFITPYVLIGAVALFWYLNARKNARNIHLNRYSQGQVPPVPHR